MRTVEGYVCAPIDTNTATKHTLRDAVHNALDMVPCVGRRELDAECWMLNAENHQKCCTSSSGSHSLNSRPVVQKLCSHQVSLLYICPYTMSRVAIASLLLVGLLALSLPAGTTAKTVKVTSANETMRVRLYYKNNQAIFYHLTEGQLTTKVLGCRAEITLQRARQH